MQLSIRPGAEIGHQTRIAGAVFAGYHHGVLYPRTAQETGLDFTRFDTETAHLNLEIVTAQIVNVAVGQPAGQIAGLVDPGRWVGGERVGNKAFGGEVGTVEVAAGDAGPADMEFTGDANRDGLVLRIQNIEAGIGERFADSRQRLGAVDHTGGGINGTFGRAVHVDKAGVGQRLQARPDGGRNRLTADEYLRGLVGRVAAQSSVEQPLQLHWGAVKQVNGVAGEIAPKLMGIGAEGVGNQH
ncbi:hypothetical protein PB72LOC_03353 [Pectobacterium atrosepticum]|nr:hypothetical protein PB72LOC_03353 [Pectobacterium atrosepticum]